MAFTRRDGCGFFIVTSVFTCLFLVFNGLFLTISYGWLTSVGPEFLERPKVQQLILFIGPVLMIFVEWTLIDYLVHWTFSWGSDKKPKP